MANNITLHFTNGTEGTLSNNNNSIHVSYTGKGMAPYELLLGGYASCLHATFKEIMNKKRISFESIQYNVEGVKREEVPTILKRVSTEITINGVEKSKQDKVLKSMKLAEKYCSISVTIENLDATIDLNVTFK